MVPEIEYTTSATAPGTHRSTTTLCHQNAQKCGRAPCEFLAEHTHSSRRGEAEAQQAERCTFVDAEGGVVERGDAFAIGFAQVYAFDDGWWHVVVPCFLDERWFS